jgi:serine/threonine-protein kinase haspin
MEAFDQIGEQTRTNQATRRRRVKTECEVATKQRVDTNSKVASRGRHTFFDDDECKSVPQEQAEQVERESTAMPQPRRSPRKTKQVPKLTPTTPRQDSALDHVRPDRIFEHELPQGEKTREQENPYQAHCAEILDLSAHALTDFTTWSAEISEHFTVTKIAEASFGEVYRLSGVVYRSRAFSVCFLSRHIVFTLSQCAWTGAYMNGRRAPCGVILGNSPASIVIVNTIQAGMPTAKIRDIYS